MSEGGLRIPLSLPWLFGEVAMIRETLDALSIRVNQLERAHNRLAHFCGMATESTTIDQDNWAKNEMGGRE